MRIVKLLAAVAALMLMTGQAAFAQDPLDVNVSFELSDTKVLANPAINIHIDQPAGQPEMGHVRLVIPKGFKLPLDAKIAAGDRLGSADLSIDAGPGCSGTAPGTGPASFPDRPIIEQDRTDEQADRGVKAVWLVDLRPVASIFLEVTGSARRGWKLDGDIPANDHTCPPIVFDGTIGPTTTGGVPILRNPKVAGDKVFKAIFNSQQSTDIDRNLQTITITP